MVKLGWPTAGNVHGDSPIPTLRVWSMAFLSCVDNFVERTAQGGLSPAYLPHEHFASHAATFFTLILGGGGDVVVGNHGLDCDTLTGSHLDGHLDVHVVT